MNRKWITRERPKIDRIACPWLIMRFIDKDAEILYVSTYKVIEKAKELGAIPLDIPGVELTHEGQLCSFDAILRKNNIQDEALHRLASIVRAADTDTLDNSAQASGFFAISLGLSHNFKDDHEMLKHGLVMYDALYSWCKYVIDEKHKHEW